MCGKNSRYISTNSTFIGSPPRVREKPISSSFKPSNLGITPACAGKTSALLEAYLAFRDHPRVCGKNVIVSVTAWNDIGSPPRVREKLQYFRNATAETRITPACAGKTRLFEELQKGYQDHPRVCGKNANENISKQLEAGSPPRVREKPRKWRIDNLVLGITPACAGKTFKFMILFKGCEDHPRVCGKNSSSFEGCRRSQGSPPRVREKQSK